MLFLHGMDVKEGRPFNNAWTSISRPFGQNGGGDELRKTEKSSNIKGESLLTEVSKSSGQLKQFIKRRDDVV